MLQREICYQTIMQNRHDISFVVSERSYTLTTGFPQLFFKESTHFHNYVIASCLFVPQYQCFENIELINRSQTCARSYLGNMFIMFTQRHQMKCIVFEMFASAFIYSSGSLRSFAMFTKFNLHHSLAFVFLFSSVYRTTDVDVH